MRTLVIRSLVTTVLSFLFVTFAQGGSEVNPPASAAIMEGYVIDYLVDNGFVPPADQGLHVEDYVTIRSDADYPTIGVYIDADGFLTPTPAWHEFNEEYCMHYARLKTPATNVLQIQVVKTTETDAGMTRSQYFFSARDIATQTGVINFAEDNTSTVMYDSSQPASGVSNNPDFAAMEENIPALMDALFAASGVGGVADPCGDVRVEHVSGDEVGVPVQFLAGFEGSFGSHLTYTWDFGDGTAPAELDKTPSHTFNEEGTYTVSVTVTGEAVEPHTGTVEVTIGGSYVFYFKTTTTGQFPEGMNLRTTVEGEIPLALNEDGVPAGEGMISGTVFEGSVLDQMAVLNCTFTLVDGLMRTEVADLNSPSETVVSLWFDLGADGFSGLPGADVQCNLPAGMPVFGAVFAGIGKAWWSGFIGLHQPSFNQSNMASIDFTNFTAGSGDVVSALHLSDTYYDDGASMSQDTVMEIRKSK